MALIFVVVNVGMWRRSECVVVGCVVFVFVFYYPFTLS